MMRDPAMASGPMQGRILIVEGLTPVSRPLTEFLEQHGYRWEMAGSAREALLLAQTGRWDAVILNIGIPAMNGVEFYTTSKSDGGRKCLAVIFASGYTKQNLLQALGKPSPASEAMRAEHVGVFLGRLHRCLRTGVRGALA